MVLDVMDMDYQPDAGTATIPSPMLRRSVFNHSLCLSEILDYYMDRFTLVVGTATIPLIMLRYTIWNYICLINLLCDWIMVCVWRLFCIWMMVCVCVGIKD